MDEQQRGVVRVIVEGREDRTAKEPMTTITNMIGMIKKIYHDNYNSNVKRRGRKKYKEQEARRKR